MEMRTPRLRRLLTPTAIAVLLLGGCSGAGEAVPAEVSEEQPGAGASEVEKPDPPETPEPTETPEPAKTPGDEPGDEPAQTEGPSAPPEGADSPECLVGDWVISEEQMQRFYDSMETPADFHITGDTGLSFAADTYEYTPDFQLKMNLGGQEASGTLTGSITGTYTAQDGVITTSNDANDIDMAITVAGVTMDGTDTGEGFIESSPVNSAPYECTSAGPVITFENTGDGVDIQLQPRE